MVVRQSDAIFVRRFACLKLKIDIDEEVVLIYRNTGTDDDISSCILYKKR